MNMPGKTNSTIKISQAEDLEIAASTRVQESKVFWAWLSLAVVVAMIALLVAGVLFWQNRNLKREVARLKTQTIPHAEVDPNKQVIVAAGKLIILPPDEEPTVATVTDLEKLKGQPFFANAAVGDKVLIYPKAQKAILFRPGENKIIESAPLNLGSGNATATKSNQLTIEIRNGSGKSGAAATFKNKLSGSKDFTVTKIGNARATYDKTMLVVLNSQKSALTAKLQALASAQVVNALPDGEAPSSADAVLILGKE